MEVGTVLVFVSTPLFEAAGSLWELVFILLFLVLLFALAVIDLRHFLLPDALVGILAVAGFGRGIVFGSPGLLGSLLGGVVGLGALGVLAVMPWPKARPGFSGSGSPMGLGDVKLAGAMGVTLGLPGLLAALFLAFVVGGIVGGLLVATRRATLNSRIPFGPFLCGATAVVLLFPNVPEVFLQLLGLK